MDDDLTILEERARALSRAPQDDNAQEGETVGLVVLEVRPERYGVDTRSVREIEPLRSVTPIRGVPGHWAGVVNLRGSMYPVLDLRRYLGLGDHAPDPAKIALVSGAGLTVGLLVDDVPELRQVSAGHLRPPVADSANTRADLIKGITTDMLNVLDVEALLADPRLAIEDEVDG